MNNPAERDEFGKAIEYLYSFIDLEQKRLDRYQASKLDPTRIGRFLALLNKPYEKFPAIHIAGTKGKGSVAALCAASLRAAGLRVGLYTSPHMQDFRERVRVLTSQDADGRIPESDFVRLMDESIRPTVTAVPDVTWFEILTSIAFLYFAEQGVDVAVVEVGLGGRLDATNVITPLVSVITSLSLDHTYFLGDTLAEIAYEKGGIIKPGVPVVTAVQPPEALHRLQEITAERGCAMTVAGVDYTYRSGDYSPAGQDLLITRHGVAGERQYALHIPLAGAHQQLNTTVALATLHVVQPHFPNLTDAAIAEGFAAVEWHGRLEILHRAPDTPTLLVDCAHNEDSAEKLALALRQVYSYERLFLVFGVSADKFVTGMIEHLFPLAERVIATMSTHPRAALPGDLAATAVSLGFTVDEAVDVETAVTQAWLSATPADLICVTGSIFIVGDLLNQWDSLKSRLTQYETER
ncbi:MAG: bifunctional folylpolyglutamate synthase/dihydrofolate synthase [Ardenticatenaceae bacterium]|nr:bifunctional folylpolyglutamate synthase/dihydrofolate synthase [Ardenticatenaceae bacterium]MCB9004115.1 bifunctional folylpolyglutamate synthase/dihydrofolate synthase [Ardenticatenaceae bacterium]